jgi:hypothetical protein
MSSQGARALGRPMMIRIVPLLVGFLVIGLMYPVNAADLTVKQLNNRQYLIPSWEQPDQGEWVQVKDGEYTRKNPDNPLFVRVVETALGSLTNKPTTDGAVIYGYNTGGSGFFVVLCAVINEQGKPKNTALIDLEDRVKINSLSIRSGKIIVDMVTHGPNDPACCPAVKKIAAYRLVGNQLVEQ